jgi:FlaA1/EpsC-like NDP-sugar epimerase
MNMHQIDVIYDSIFYIGGHLLLAARLVQKVQTEMNVNVGVVELFSHATIEALANLMLQKQGDATGTVSAPSPPAVDLVEEVKIHDTPADAVNDMAMRAFWRSTHFKRVYERSILLTGGTGFLGSFLLDQLLKNDDIDIVYCLVRATSYGEAAHRLHSARLYRNVIFGMTTMHLVFKSLPATLPFITLD